MPKPSLNVVPIRRTLSHRIQTWRWLILHTTSGWQMDFGAAPGRGTVHRCAAVEKKNDGGAFLSAVLDGSEVKL
jgi:hypothetical protein